MGARIGYRTGPLTIGYYYYYSKGPIIDAGPVIDTPTNINSYYRFNDNTANLTFLNLSKPTVIYFMNMNQLQVHARQIVVLF